MVKDVGWKLLHPIAIIGDDADHCPPRWFGVDYPQKWSVIGLTLMLFNLLGALWTPEDGRDGRTHTSTGRMGSNRTFF